MQAVPPLNRMRQYLETADEPEPFPAAVPPGQETPVSIVFEDVCFSYGGKNSVLDHFNLNIDAGEKVALVGMNGAGKTTIIKLLCGFYKPDSGRILINVENCLKKVGLWDDIRRMPHGMDSAMGNLEENGVSLSGGQQQKLLMARALYKGAQILLFDEPTAALDPIAESETYEMFHGLSGDKTAVYISHRLASTLFCDRVVFLENGSVKASGSHMWMMRNCREYNEMYELQSQYYKKAVAE